MILIIENEVIEASVMCLLLQQEVFPDGTPSICQHATSGRDAITWLIRQPPFSVSVVLLDRSLGGGENGLSLIPWLRQSPALRSDACILVWSGHDEPEMVKDARLAGADGFISKQRATRTLGQEIVQLVADMWVIDRQERPRPWMVLARSGQSMSYGDSADWCG